MNWRAKKKNYLREVGFSFLLSQTGGVLSKTTPRQLLDAPPFPPFVSQPRPSSVEKPCQDLVEFLRFLNHRQVPALRYDFQL